MSGPSEAALDDICRRLDQLHSEIQILAAHGRATLAAVAGLSPDTRRAVADALAEEAAGFGLSGAVEVQADLFEASAKVEGAGAPETRMARRLELALVEQAAALDEDEAERMRRFG